MRLLRTFVLVVLPLSVALGTAHARLGAQARPHGVDLTAMETRVDPCTDFYQFACGQWRAKNPVKPDEPRWGRFNELDERNTQTLRQILDQASAAGPRDPETVKIGDYYASCMDESAIEAKGLTPLQPELDAIAAIGGKADLPKAIARLHGLGTNALFRFGSDQDLKDSTRVIADTDQGGIALPDRDYYLKDDERTVAIRKAFTEHVQKLFELMGHSPADAAAETRTVVEIQTELARGSLDRVKRREPSNIYHKMPIAEVQALTPSFDWKTYLAAVGAPSVTEMNVAVPDFLKAVEQLVASRPIADVKTYLTWQLVHANAFILPKKFADEDFRFYGTVLTGAKENRPRWKRCVQSVDADLGEALGKAYAKQTFGAEGKERTLKMVNAIERSLEKDINALDWMTDATRKQALAKLKEVTNKIGYPNQWRDYSALRIARGDALGNSVRSNAFEFKRQLDKIGKPVDRDEWLMTPPTVNAYYLPTQNNINFPAGILQPPFFDREADDASNFGAAGAVIGHELTHGFDDQGRQFDGKGNLRDWWSERDGKEFEQRASCIANQYGGYTAVGDVKLNGKLTLGENVADNGGLRLAYMALMETLAGKTAPKVDGYTPEQRFFLGWGQIWCENQTDEVARLMAATNPHSPGQYRVNGVVSNMPEFAKAFNCKADAPMAKGSACRVW
jgi:putative endopeptidase